MNADSLAGAIAAGMVITAILISVIFHDHGFWPPVLLALLLGGAVAKWLGCEGKFIVELFTKGRSAAPPLLPWPQMARAARAVLIDELHAYRSLLFTYRPQLEL